VCWTRQKTSGQRRVHLPLRRHRREPVRNSNSAKFHSFYYARARTETVWFGHVHEKSSTHAVEKETVATNGTRLESWGLAECIVDAVFLPVSLFECSGPCARWGRLERQLRTATRIAWLHVCASQLDVDRSLAYTLEPSGGRTHYLHIQ
jgi:hypothetical protein